jgi:ankyrin repeat protein
VIGWLNVTVPNSCSAREIHFLEKTQVRVYVHSVYHLHPQNREKHFRPEIQIDYTIGLSKHHTTRIHHPFALKQLIQHESNKNNNEHKNSFPHNFKNTQSFSKPRLP